MTDVSYSAFSSMLTEKLSLDNYFSWKENISLILKFSELLGVVDGSETKPTDAAAAAAWTKKDAKASSLIQLAMEPNVRSHINASSLPTSNDLWKATQAAFSGKSPLGIMSSLTKFIQLRMQTSEDILEYCGRFRTSVRELKAMGQDLPDTVIVAKLLEGLSADWEVVRTTLMSTPADQLTIDHVVQRLTQERLYRVTTDTPTTTALAIKQPPSTSGVMKPDTPSAKQPKGEKQWCKHHQRHCNHSTNECLLGKRRQQQQREQAKQQPSTAQPAPKQLATVAIAASTISADSTSWITDSGAGPNHMTGNKQLLQQLTPLPTPIAVTVANGATLTATHYGSVTTDTLSLDHVLYVPGLHFNLLSVRAMDRRQHTTVFQQGKLYVTNRLELPSASIKAVASATEDSYLFADDALVLSATTHQLLGHMSQDKVDQLQRQHHELPGQPASDNTVCDPCAAAKATKSPIDHKHRHTSAAAPLHRLHSDIVEMPRYSRQGYKYWVTLEDDYSRFVFITCLKRKSEAPTAIIQMIKAAMTAQDSKIPKQLLSDNGAEYLSKSLQSYLAEHGIEHVTSPPYSPELNGIPERINRTLLDTVRTLLIDSGLPDAYWQDALATAAYVYNRTPHSATGTTPYQLWSQDKPNYFECHRFGCDAWVLVEPRQHKLAQRAIKCQFLGYLGKGGYTFVHRPTNKIIYSRNAKFADDSITRATPPPTISIPLADLPEDTEQPPASQQQLPAPQEQLQQSPVTQQIILPHSPPRPAAPAPPPPRHSSRAWHPTEAALQQFARATEVVKLSYDEAMRIPEWRTAIEEEFANLRSNNVYELDPSPPVKPLGTTFVFRVKYDDNDQPYKYRARLVALGNHQHTDAETYAPVLRFETLRAMLSLAHERNWEVHQLDVAAAFLNAPIDETICVKAPNGEIWRLRKALYGLRQSPQLWNSTLDQHLRTEMHFTPTSADPCLYVSTDAMIGVYVDDMPIAAPASIIHRIKEQLTSRFKCTDGGLIHHLLGVTIGTTPQGYHLSQRPYIDKLIEDFSILNTAKTPIEDKQLLEDTTPAEDAPYRNLIGCLQFIASHTRPDIAYATSFLARYSSAPTKAAWQQAQRIVRYLAGTRDLGITLHGSNMVCYCDANWSGVDNDYSTTGYIVLLGDSPIAWRSSKQDTVALSSTEAEYMAASEATQEILYLKNLLAELGAPQQTVTLFLDNKGSIDLARKAIFRRKTRHISVKYHFIRHHVQNNDINIQHVSSTDNFADFLTKGLQHSALVKNRNHVMCSA